MFTFYDDISQIKQKGITNSKDHNIYLISLEKNIKYKYFSIVGQANFYLTKPYKYK